MHPLRLSLFALLLLAVLGLSQEAEAENESIFVSSVKWYDSNGNLTNYSYEGAELSLEINVSNPSTYEIDGSLLIEMRKDGRDFVSDSYGEIEPNYNSLDILPESFSFFNFSSNKLPTVSFQGMQHSEAPSLDGIWTVNITIEYQDSEGDVKYIYNETMVEVVKLADLSIYVFESSNYSILEDEVIDFNVTLQNSGGDVSHGKFGLYHASTLLYLHTFNMSELQVEGISYKNFTISYKVPHGFDGQLSLKLCIERATISPSISPSDSVDDDCKSLNFDVSARVPQLRVSNFVWFSKSAVLENDSLSVYVDIWNTGTLDSDANVIFYVLDEGGEEYDTVDGKLTLTSLASTNVSVKTTDFSVRAMVQWDNVPFIGDGNTSEIIVYAIAYDSGGKEIQTNDNSNSGTITVIKREDISLGCISGSAQILLQGNYATSYSYAGEETDCSDNLATSLSLSVKEDGSGTWVANVLDVEPAVSVLAVKWNIMNEQGATVSEGYLSEIYGNYDMYERGIRHIDTDLDGKLSSSDKFEIWPVKDYLFSLTIYSEIPVLNNSNEETDDADTTDGNTGKTTSDSVEKEDEEVDYTLPIIGIGILIAVSILGAAVILKR